MAAGLLVGTGAPQSGGDGQSGQVRCGAIRNALRGLPLEAHLAHEGKIQHLIPFGARKGSVVVEDTLLALLEEDVGVRVVHEGLEIVGADHDALVGCAHLHHTLAQARQGVGVDLDVDRPILLRIDDEAAAPAAPLGIVGGDIAFFVAVAACQRGMKHCHDRYCITFWRRRLELSQSSCPSLILQPSQIWLGGFGVISTQLQQ